MINYALFQSKLLMKHKSVSTKPLNTKKKNV